jgi:ethanolamine utilization protein
MNTEKKDINQKQLIDLITSEVINYLKSNQSNESVVKKPVLVLGSIEEASCIYSDKYEYFGVDSYACDGDIEKYCFVIINKITSAQLCDIALGRDSTPYTCAVQKALLKGKKVYMFESALSHRMYKETAAKELYGMLEKYVQKLLDFGVNFAQEKQMEFVSEQGCGKDVQSDTCEKVITFTAAQRLCKNGKKQLVLPKGAIITPLAKDLFIAEKIEIKMMK